MAIKRKITSLEQQEKNALEESNAAEQEKEKEKDATESLMDALEKARWKGSCEGNQETSLEERQGQVHSYEIEQKEEEIRRAFRTLRLHLRGEERIQQELCSGNVHLCHYFKVANIKGLGLHVVENCTEPHFLVAYCVFCREVIEVTVKTPSAEHEPETQLEDVTSIPESRYPVFEEVIQRDVEKYHALYGDRETISDALKRYLDNKEYQDHTPNAFHFNRYDSMKREYVHALYWGLMPMTNRVIQRIEDLKKELASMKAEESGEDYGNQTSD